jgi:hypothetical protein
MDILIERGSKRWLMLLISNTLAMNWKIIWDTHKLLTWNWRSKELSHLKLGTWIGRHELWLGLYSLILRIHEILMHLLRIRNVVRYNCCKKFIFLIYFFKIQSWMIIDMSISISIIQILWWCNFQIVIWKRGSIDWVISVIILNKIHWILSIIIDELRGITCIKILV